MKTGNLEAVMGRESMSIVVRGRHWMESGQSKIAELGRDASLKLARYICRKWGFVASDVFYIRGNNGRMLSDDKQTAR